MALPLCRRKEPPLHLCETIFCRKKAICMACTGTASRYCTLDAGVCHETEEACQNPVCGVTLFPCCLRCPKSRRIFHARSTCFSSVRVISWLDLPSLGLCDNEGGLGHMVNATMAKEDLLLRHVAWYHCACSARYGQSDGFSSPDAAISR